MGRILALLLSGLAALAAFPAEAAPERLEIAGLHVAAWIPAESAPGSLGGIAVPAMYQTGTLDLGVAPFVVRPGRAFDQTPKPKYLVDFTRAGHLAWTDLNSAYQAEIVSYSLAFLGHALRGKPFPPALAGAHAGVAEVRVLE